MSVIKRVDVMSFALFMAILYAMIGLIAGILFGLFSLGLSRTVPYSVGFGLASVILFPLLYGIMGFIAGAIGALLMNLAFRITGGVKLDISR